jgi:hypothetical protein
MAVTIAVDLRQHFGPVRDQGDRPTCLAFAASDAHAACRPDWEPLSAEYAFFHAQKRSGQPPDRGTYLETMLDALRLDGQPIEQSWPYLLTLPNDLGTYAPPATVDDVFGRDGDRASVSFGTITASLAAGSAVIILTKLTMPFFRPPVEAIIDYADGDDVFPVPRHAMIAVGYGSIGPTDVILIRNSWGSSWGQGGYAWVTRAYVEKNSFDLAILTEETDVSYRAVAA